MELYLRDRNEVPLKLGDKVRILKFTNDSGNATELFGVENQLNAWVNMVYLESFEGEITFDLETYMVVIKGKYTHLPLSEDIRHQCWEGLYDMLVDEDLYNIQEEFKLPDTKLITLVNYIEKI
jgi:hypothetical protein